MIATAGQCIASQLASIAVEEREMGRFHFHLIDEDQFIADDEGSELPDFSAAQPSEKLY